MIYNNCVKTVTKTVVYAKRFSESGTVRADSQYAQMNITSELRARIFSRV